MQRHTISEFVYELYFNVIFNVLMAQFSYYTNNLPHSALIVALIHMSWLTSCSYIPSDAGNLDFSHKTNKTSYH